MSNTDKKYVFISYSTKNKDFANALRDILNKNNIHTWMAPTDILPGSKYAVSINRAIKDCACFLLVLTNESQNSIWVAKETGRAVNYRKPIIPVRMADIVLNDEFELYIGSEQIVQVSADNDINTGINSMLYAVSKYIAVSKTASAPSHSNSGASDGGGTLKCLFALCGRDNRPIHELPVGNFLVGRSDRKSNIIINDAKVSSVHCMLRVAAEAVYIMDLNSTNGTYVNNMSLGSECEFKLRPGDVIRLGKTEYVLCRMA